MKDSNIDLRTQGAQGETKGTADQYVVNKFNEQATKSLIKNWCSSLGSLWIAGAVPLN